jgi:hypothetical protein
MYRCLAALGAKVCAWRNQMSVQATCLTGIFFCRWIQNCERGKIEDHPVPRKTAPDDASCFSAVTASARRRSLSEEIKEIDESIPKKSIHQVSNPVRQVPEHDFPESFAI